MFFKSKYHIRKLYLIIFFSLVGCQFQDPYKNHGITFLDNRSNKLVVKKSNFNDVIRILGQPHSKSIVDDTTWIYIERVLTKGEFHKIGKNILKSKGIIIVHRNKKTVESFSERLKILDTRYYGLSNIPNEFKENLMKYDELNKIAHQLSTLKLI